MKGSEAEILLREYIAGAGETLADDSWQIATAGSLLGTCRTARKDFEEAERLFLESCAIINGDLGKRHEMTRQAIQRIVHLYEA